MIRVLRLLEYEYDTAETAERDMRQWQVPSTGAKKFGSHETIRSSVIIDLAPSAHEKAQKYDELFELIEKSSLASDGWEMIETAFRQKDENESTTKTV